MILVRLKMAVVVMYSQLYSVLVCPRHCAEFPTVLCHIFFAEAL